MSTAPIAERTISLRAPDGARVEVIIRLHSPEPDLLPGGAFRCSFDIGGLPESPTTRVAYGEDSYQALVHAIELIHVEIDRQAVAAKLIDELTGGRDFRLLPRRL